MHHGLPLLLGHLELAEIERPRGHDFVQDLLHLAPLKCPAGTNTKTMPVAGSIHSAVTARAVLEPSGLHAAATTVTATSPFHTTFNGSLWSTR